ncbi:hypothetical protein ACTJJ7_15655 [Phyllobacterium sp. 22229]|uniref:hypothetical protein n=1 Tax=Phyllobacterium sp. 22229 TaxID=3453895 RepID=UPI003F847A0E
MSMFEGRKITPKHELYSVIAAIQQFDGSNSSVASAIAKNALDVDLGTFGNGGLSNYHFDEVTRNRLLAHARQDAAHAVAMAHVTAREVKSLKFIVLLLVLLVVALCIYLFVKL